MTQVHVSLGGTLTILLGGVDSFRKRCPDQFAGLQDACAFVNWRRTRIPRLMQQAADGQKETLDQIAQIVDNHFGSFPDTYLRCSFAASLYPTHRRFGLCGWPGLKSPRRRLPLAITRKQLSRRSTS